MLRLQLLWTSLRSALAFLQRYRDRVEVKRLQDIETQRTQALDQRLLIEGILVRLEGILKVKDETLHELAHASIAQSQAFSKWLDTFNPATSQTPIPDPQLSQADEWEPAFTSSEIPAEFRLAASLHKLQELGDLSS